MRPLARFWYQRRGFWFDVAPACVYLAVLLLAGLMPLRKLPGPEFELADKVWHLAAFGGLAALFARAFSYWAVERRRAARDAALLSGLLGGALEVLQSFTPYRSADFADLVADALGALLAYLVLRLLIAVDDVRGVA
jgi:VanZ family protein